MAFIEVDRWHGGSPLAVFGPSDAASSTFAWRPPELAIDARSLERGIAGTASLGITWLVVSALMLRGVQAADTRGSRRIETLQLVELDITPPGPQPTPAPAASGSGPPPVAAVATSASPVNTNAPTSLSIAEWTVSRIAARPLATPTAVRSAGSAIGPGVATGTGQGGSGVYDPYAGASPERRVEPASAGLDPRVLAAAVVLLRREHPDWRGGLRCTVRLSPSGAVALSQCTRGSGNAEPSEVARVLVGLRLFNASGDERTLMLNIEL